LELGRFANRLSSRPPAELKHLRDGIIAECRELQKKNARVGIRVVEDFGLPVVLVDVYVSPVRFPTLVLRVRRDYHPKTAPGASFAFHRPPAGWIGIVGSSRARFFQATRRAPPAGLSVGALAELWEQQVQKVCLEAKVPVL